MINIATASLFPGVFEAYCREGLFAKAIEKGLVGLLNVNIRDFTADKHRTADDIPFGGGPGMVIKPGPVVRAVESLGDDYITGEIVVVSPRGELFDQTLAEKWSRLGFLTIICGRYKGIDARVTGILGAREVSVGDYILGAGEIAALSIIDSVARLLPGYLGDELSVEVDSLSGPERLLSAPEYTRPREFRGIHVPEILLSGNHAAMADWKRRQSLALTAERRPGLLDKAALNDEERAFVSALREIERNGDKAK